MTKNHTKAVEAEVEATEELITPKQLASELGTDPKTFRRFLRGFLRSCRRCRFLVAIHEGFHIFS